ncbi:MAG: multiheme c-type cytochrome, partial [Steroidobacterales bacterium]
MSERLQHALALALILVLVVPVARSDSAESGRHLGVASCASSLCHGSAKPTTTYAVAQNEYVTWSHFDPHAGAYRSLVDERGAAIAKRLGLPNAYQAKQCLDCHADNVAQEARGPRFQITDGVGCESCHGGAESWIASHDDVPAVRHADNLAQGLRALEEPSVRVEV